MTPKLCEQCLAKNVVATLNGPTCSHHAHGSGATWFPDWWTPKNDEPNAFGRESRRLEYIEKLNREPEPATPVLEFDFG